jgi:hypothetical protein
MKRSPVKRKRVVTPMKRCDALAAAINRERAGYTCEGREGHRCSMRLQWAHVQSRSYHWIRHMESNALLLCSGEHLYFTNHPLEWIDFVGEEQWLALKHEAMLGLGLKIDWRDREAHLRARLEELSG